MRLGIIAKWKPDIISIKLDFKGECMFSDNYMQTLGLKDLLFETYNLILHVHYQLINSCVCIFEAYKQHNL